MPIYLLIFSRMLILQQLCNPSDEEVEFQVNERRSFAEFVGLGVMNSIEDAITVAFFRERLRKAVVIEGLFEMFEAYLRSQGLHEVARLSMRLLFPSQSNAILARRMQKLKPGIFRMVGNKIQPACHRRT